MSVVSNLLSTTPRKSLAHSRQAWYPRALRWWNLVLATVICLTFIVILEFFLAKSQRDGGIIFAPKVNDLPLRQSFAYLYLPTIIAVIFSIYIVWIDIDAKRYEPYHQLSKPEGALGKDSLLLHYPFDFIPVVPFVAFKNRHWLVFWASAAAALTTFGIVPLQAGIFVTETVTRTFANQNFLISRKFMHASKQQSDLTLAFALSASGILQLNETLPPYMTLDYALAPFTALSDPTLSETWTANTTLYTLDLECEDARETPYVGDSDHYFWGKQGPSAWNSSANCQIGQGDFGNAIIGEEILTFSLPTQYWKIYSTIYAAYYRYNGGLVGERPAESLHDAIHFNCDEETMKHAFFAAFVRNRANEKDPRNRPAAIFCTPKYHEQAVQATIDATAKAPRNIIGLGPKMPLQAELFNTTLFEQVVVQGAKALQADSSAMPITQLPTYVEFLGKSNLSSGRGPPSMAVMAAIASGEAMKDCVDSKTLAASYQKAYRLLFVRAMTDVLLTNFSSESSQVLGTQYIQTEAVALQPLFVHIVVVFLGCVSLAIMALLYIEVFGVKNRQLRSDPGTVAAVMSIAAENVPFLTSFEDLDTCSKKYLDHKLSNKRFKLDTEDFGPRLIEVMLPTEVDATPGETAKPTRPIEFRLFTLITFASLFVGLAVTLGVLFYKSRPYGLPLPSHQRIVQTLIREYVPTAVATLIEPLWILVNRMICMLQPLEELHRTRAAPASKSITLNYNSLPPQLVIFKAIKSRHYFLAIICTMALLANLLATAFAALLFQEVIERVTYTRFAPPFQSKFVYIDGFTDPLIDGGNLVYSGAFEGHISDYHFMIAESNYTRNTTLPSWTDQHAFYMPYFDDESGARLKGAKLEAKTLSVSADLICKPAVFDVDYHFEIWDYPWKAGSNYTYWLEFARGFRHKFTATITSPHGRRVNCIPRHTSGISSGLGSSAAKKEYCHSGKVAAELVATLRGLPNSTSSDSELCLSSVAILYMRHFSPTSCNPAPETKDWPQLEPAADNTFMMVCQPEVKFGEARVRVDSAGLLLEPAEPLGTSLDRSEDAFKDHFTSGEKSLTSQANMFIFPTLQSHWHNSTHASEYIHHFANRAISSLNLTDPNTPLPKFTDVEAPIRKAYTRLFAIWLGVNRNLLFEPEPSSERTAPAIIFQEEERLFFKTSLFLVSELILVIYALTAVLLYFKRPGRYLPRMPTSIATVISLFASSAAVRDMKGTSGYSTSEREKFLDESGNRYGYGSYIGSDGCVHVGIEKTPFVTHRSETTFDHSRFDKERRKQTFDVSLTETGSEGMAPGTGRQESWLKRVGTGQWFGEKRK